MSTVEYIPRGKFFEDFNIGDAFCTSSRTVSEVDITNFAGLSSDFVQLHISEEFAKTTIHKGRIAHGALTFAISTGQLSLSGILDGTVVAILNSVVDFTAAVHIGDTIRTIIEVTEKKETKKPGYGIVKLASKVYNQHDVMVLQHVDTIMMLRKPCGKV